MSFSDMMFLFKRSDLYLSEELFTKIFLGYERVKIVK